MAFSTDPVCTMKVRKKKEGRKERKGNRTYYFCSEECQRQFQQNPAEYAA